MIRKLSLFVVVAISMVLVATTSAVAADDDPLALPKETAVHAAGNADTGPMALRTIISMVIVIAVILAVYHALRWLSRKTSLGRDGAVRRLNRTVLDKDTAIYTVQLGDTVSVIGRAGGSMEVIKSLSVHDADQQGLTEQDAPALSTLTSRLKNAKDHANGKRSSPSIVPLKDLLDRDSESSSR